MRKTILLSVVALLLVPALAVTQPGRMWIGSDTLGATFNAAVTMDTVANAEIVGSGDEERLIFLFIGGECSAETSRDLQNQLQLKLQLEGIAVNLFPHECRAIRVPRGGGSVPDGAVVFDFAVSLHGGSLDDLATAATSVPEVAAAEISQKGGTSFTLHLLLSGPCGEIDGAYLADRVELTAAQSEVETTLWARKCREVIVPRSGPGMMGFDSIAAVGMFVTPS